MHIRPIARADLPALARMLDTIELFPGDMLADLIAPCLTDPASDDVWLTAETDGEPVALLYAVPEPATDRAWNMRAIGVRADRQGGGIGRRMVERLEATLRERGQRLLIVDTSGTDGFAGSRAFYRALGYAEEGRVRDFWADGDSKVVYRKRL